LRKKFLEYKQRREDGVSSEENERSYKINLFLLNLNVTENIPFLPDEIITPEFSAIWLARSKENFDRYFDWLF